MRCACQCVQQLLLLRCQVRLHVAYGAACRPSWGAAGICKVFASCPAPRGLDVSFTPKYTLNHRHWLHNADMNKRNVMNLLLLGAQAALVVALLP